MEVKAISNSQPSFNGVLGKNIQIYVNNTVEHEINTLVRNANYSAKHVDVDLVKSIKALGNRVLTKFRDYVQPMNEKTVFDMDNDLESSFIRTYFSNPIAPNGEVKIYHISVNDKTAIYNTSIGTPAFIDVSKLSRSSLNDLEILDKMADELFKIPHKKIDEILYKNAQHKLKNKALTATGFISKYIVRKWANALDKFAEGLGLDRINKARTEEYIKRANEDKKAQKEMRKTTKIVSKENQKIADEILNS